MTIAGQQLAAVQLAGHRAIDSLYGPLAGDVEQMVIGHLSRPTNAITASGLNALPLIRRDLGQMLAGITFPLVTLIVNAARDAETVADPDGRVDETALAFAGMTSLGSIRRNQPSVLRQVDALVLRGVGLGLTAIQTAKTVKEYFSPWFSPRRDEAGRLLRGDRVGAIASWPGRSGMASQHVRGIMLFETTAGHGRGMVRRATREETLLRYHVSHKHLEIDNCDRLERQDVGFGPGLYPPDAFPGVPQHFRCRCYAESADRPRFLARSESVAA